ncbi:MAG: hypothetical protein ACUZ8A_04355, partial [Candidatus Bathyanammoxibius sp.]
GIVTLVILFFMGYAASGTATWYAAALQYLGTYSHWEPFTKGMVNTKDILYYVTITALCLFITVRVVESRKWR